MAPSTWHPEVSVDRVLGLARALRDDVRPRARGDVRGSRGGVQVLGLLGLGIAGGLGR